MNKAKVDVAVLIIFFTRDEQLSKVFDQVKLARPSKLYLYQDGAREGRKDDEEAIKRCREIVSDDNIDWECEVHRLYQDKNYGCDPSEFIAQKWMFETEEMGIILEDDDVPSQSFFPFCKELLEYYKDDERINMICGMNNTGVSTHIDSSYLFTLKGSIWGWASWKRVLDTWDGEYKWLDDEQMLNKVKSQMTRSEFKDYIKTAKMHKASGREHYESINAASFYLHNRMNIVPKYNMISNIGISQESTHSVSDIRLLPKRTQNLLYMKTYEIDFPLIHPKEYKRDCLFEKKMTPNKIQKICGKIEHYARVIRYKGFKYAFGLLRNKISKVKK